MTSHRVVARSAAIVAHLAAAAAWALPSGVCAQRISVGRTVPISADARADVHGESFLAVNPNDPANLLATTNVVRQTRAGTSAYVSNDAGATWARIVLPDGAQRLRETWDVIAYFDPKGNSYYGAMYYGPYHKVDYGAGLMMTRSSDKGRTWSDATLLPGAHLFDRPYMGFDAAGRFAGRTYAGGRVTATGLDGKRYSALAIAFSGDSARHFGPPRLIVSAPDEDVGVIANMVVTTDGTVIVPFTTSKPMAPPTDARPPMRDSTSVRETAVRMAVSKDGGDSYTISPRLFTWRQIGNRGHGLPTTVIDRSTGPFAGRIYFLWEEDTPDRTDIRVSHSSDGGKTWSRPVTVNDNSTPGNHVNPTIAVDSRGVVGVAWNDRRAHKDACYDLYFSASLDGGETFLPNVTPGGKPTCPTMIPNGGETQGLVGVADGGFYAAWIDGSSGVTQLAGTRFTVEGEVRGAARR